MYENLIICNISWQQELASVFPCERPSILIFGQFWNIYHPYFAERGLKYLSKIQKKQKQWFCLKNGRNGHKGGSFVHFLRYSFYLIVSKRERSGFWVQGEAMSTIGISLWVSHKIFVVYPLKGEEVIVLAHRESMTTKGDMW